MVKLMLKISIVTVSYNAADTIEQTISSVVNQTYENIEYIIIDGGSTDGTVDIIRKYEDRIAYWVSKPDNGVYDAMNKGIDVATGDYIYFLGADDALVCTKTLYYVCNDIKETYADVYSYCEYMVTDNGMQKFVSNKFARNEKLIKSMIPHQGMFVKTILAKKNIFDVKYKIAADFKFFLQCRLKKSINIAYKDMPIAYFSLSGLSGNQSKIMEQEVREIYRELQIEYPNDCVSGYKLVLKKILKAMRLFYPLIKLRDSIGWNRHKCDNELCRWCRRK